MRRISNRPPTTEAAMMMVLSRDDMEECEVADPCWSVPAVGDGAPRPVAIPEDVGFEDEPLVGEKAPLAEDEILEEDCVLTEDPG